MERQRHNQPDANQRLNAKLDSFLSRTVFTVFLIELFQHLKYRLRQLYTITKPAETFDQRTDDKAADKHRHADRRHADQEIGELPACAFGDDQVLRFTDHGHHAAQRRANARMHHQAAQKGAELLEDRLVLLIAGEGAVVVDVSAFALI